MRNKLREQRGEFLLSTAMKLLAGAMLLSAAVEVYHVYHTLGVVKEKANEAVLAVAAVNVSEFYGGAREGDGFARHPEDGSFAYSIATDDVVDMLVQSLNATGLDEDDTITVGKSFSVASIRTQYMNYSGGNLNFQTNMTVTVPLELGGVLLPAVTKQMEVKTSYAPKF
ncbi:MAG: hypothetical protein VB060_08925 [Oscillibacter sp.]|uniref:hypothetical protein n=1 Tax=uncultured Oscillibacter sp. TaxID=876091 RepID=UPI0025F190F6|nr:hypothetical protein [Oscillibacter sp.]MEA4993935.1 hypothetical protein [Oscillibacter sp.]